MSCIHVDDIAGLALWAIGQENFDGPVNAVMPYPVTNTDFTRLLARAVHRPAILPAPAFVLRAVLGEMASLLLDSSRVRPGVAEERGYPYEFADVEKALAQVAH